MHRRGGSGLERLLGCAGIFWCFGWCSGELPELIVGSPEVILELLGGHFGVSEGHFSAFEGDFCSLESIRSSGFHFPRVFGVIFAVELIFGTTKMISGHIELIPSSNSFAACYSIQPARSYWDSKHVQATPRQKKIEA